MSKYIVLYNFNKYYNRKIKRLATFADYEALITPGDNTPAQYKGFKREFRNFDFSDGVYAKHIINIAKNELLSFKVDQPDYFVLEESYTVGDGEEATTTTKVSRWFVLEAVRTRGNQYELSLRRDLLADYYYDVLQAPVFIQRGCPQQYSDPAIFNKEGFTFNQIKKYELLLNGNKLSGNGAGWIVGYINRYDQSENNNEIAEDIGPCLCKQEINLDVPNFEDLPDNLQSILTNLSDVTVDNKYETNITFPIKRREEYYEPGYGYRQRSVFNDIYFKYIHGQGLTNLQLTGTTSRDGAFPYFDYYRKYEHGDSTQYALFSVSDIITFVRENIGNYGVVAVAFQDIIDNDSSRTYIEQDTINQYNNTYYKRNNKYYKIVFSAKSTYTLRRQYTGAQLTSQYDNLAFQSLVMLQNLITISSQPERVIRNPDWDLNAYAISIDRYMPVYGVTIEESDATEFEVQIPKTRNQLLDAPYDMFVMPLGAVTVKGRTGEADFITLLNTSLAAARGIAAFGTSLRILDIQILPYCPFDEVIDSDGNIDLSSAVEDIDYTIIKKTLGQDLVDIGVILYPLHSQGTFNYDILQNHDSLETAVKDILLRNEGVLEQKVLSETSLVRFVSPNFAAIYDMNPQKNGSNGATVLTIDYFYKPYTPYLHVKPVFGEDSMYGIESHDPKGLICSGDFSIATASSKWEEYQVQNKNYQNIFDRQIQNLDVNNSIALEQQKLSGGIGIATSAMQGAAAGAVAGGMTGNPFVAAAGAVVGAVSSTVTSAVGFAKDMEHLKRSQTEARSYAVDMYTYQLGNIQALPNTLNRVSTFTPNNKIFPFIEIYSCTEEEKEALRNKIIYNGMTIGRIGHIENFINNQVSYYVQGDLIRLEGIDEDSHVIAEIANEIKEGAYYYGSDTSES